MSQKNNYSSKVAIAKDHVQIIRDLLFIFVTSYGIYTAPPLISRQKETIQKTETIASEKLRNHRLDSVKKLSDDIVEIDEQLKNAPYKDGPTWERLKAVRDMKEKDIKRYEIELNKD